MALDLFVVAPMYPKAFAVWHQAQAMFRWLAADFQPICARSGPVMCCCPPHYDRGQQIFSQDPRMISLFEPTRFGDITTANRIVMAPLTRDRAGPGQVPTPMMATYYEQRASAGLIVTEATQISAEGQG